jgi:hypothetical protein
VEGGTNRTTAFAVQGVGAANREQIERVFYRAFLFLLPSSARPPVYLDPVSRFQSTPFLGSVSWFFGVFLGGHTCPTADKIGASQLARR